jgi:hypothetical protein
MIPDRFAETGALLARFRASSEKWASHGPEPRPAWRTAAVAGILIAAVMAATTLLDAHPAVSFLACGAIAFMATLLIVVPRIVAERNRPYVLNAYASDVLMHLAFPQIPIDPEMHAHDTHMARALIEGLSTGRLTEMHILRTCALMKQCSVRSALILSAHMDLMMAAEALRDPEFAQALKRVRSNEGEGESS